MDTLPDIPVQVGSSLQEKAKVYSAGFEGGYRQRSGDDINSIRGTATATWGNITKAQKDTLVAFFKDKKGVTAFLWQAPYEDSPRKWTCESWQPKPKLAGRFSMTASFTEEFDL